MSIEKTTTPKPPESDPRAEREAPRGLRARFERFATAVTKWAGSPLSFAAALGSVLVWAASGHAFGYSETWQLVINTGTTFLMFFLIQQSQNKDSVAVHLKLDELLASQERASNRLVDIENLDEAQLKKIQEFYSRVAKRAENNPADPACSFGDL
jgi:low affinity Fe/Cu permease